MADEHRKLHVVFIPYFTHSHIIPLVDVARLFAFHGVNVSIVTTPQNAALFKHFIDWNINSGHQITVHSLAFPSKEVGLPEGIEGFNVVRSMEDAIKVSKAIALLQKPMEDLIRFLSPNCIVSDMFFPWTIDLAEELKIPRLLFYANSFLYKCAAHSLSVYAPQKNLKSESESFVIPDLPDKIEMKMSQLEENMKKETHFGKLMEIVRESEHRSYGVIFDTFYELEPAYAEHYKKINSKKSWNIGPLFHFSNRDKVQTESGESSCLSWLDTQKPNSVVFICFGSMIRFPYSQFTEIALALEASNVPFVWVVRKGLGEGEENWLPEGFEEKKKGVIIRGWAPQMKILSHPAIGGFMTHCGWNSVLEAIIGGVPLITWPLFAEQFYNEKLIELVGIGTGVGSEVWNSYFEIKSPLVGREKIEKAVTRLMGGSEEAERIRRRAKEMSVAAKRAVQEGGSSCNDLTSLIKEMESKI